MSRPPPSDKPMRQTNFYVPIEHHERLVALSRRRGDSVTVVLRELIRRFLGVLENDQEGCDGVNLIMIDHGARAQCPICHRSDVRTYPLRLIDEGHRPVSLVVLGEHRPYEAPGAPTEPELGTAGSPPDEPTR